MKRTAALGLILLAVCQGCVSRSITIKSEPAGARTYLDGEYIGEDGVRLKSEWERRQELAKYEKTTTHKGYK